jgi:hypothetical protein
VSVLPFEQDRELAVIDGGKEVAAGRSKPLTQEAIQEMYDAKLINKASFIQLAIAHDFGVLGNPNLDENQCNQFASKWNEDITPSDMRKALDKLLNALHQNDPESDNFPQLKLF